MIYEWAGYLSGVAILISFVPYIRDIFLRKTRPERASWLIWAILGAIAFFSQLAKGASYSDIFTAGQALGDLLVFFLSLKYGIGGLLKRDKISLIGVAICLITWYLTKEAAIALFITIFIDGIGVILTMIKTYEHPETETISTWVYSLIGSVLACFAVGSLNPVLLAFPLYIGLACVGVLLSVKLGRMKTLR